MNITVYLNNGKEIKLNDPTYNAIAFAEALNNPQIIMVSIADVVLNRHSITMVAPTVTTLEPVATEEPTV